MIGVRKLLDYVFTRRELKILDDVMPEHRRKAIEEMRKEGEDKEPKDNLSPSAAGMIGSGSSGNVAIPLANGNVLKIPVDKFSSESGTEQQQINISEQLTKSSAWKTIEQKNSIPKNQKSNSSSATSS